MSPVPFFREAGAGPGVVCIHANASSSSQWRGLMDKLSGRFHVIAPDTHGAGKGPPWPRDRTLRLKDEVDLLEPVFARAGDPFALIGHSYGAGVALMAAVLHPARVKALALYEPTIFALVDAVSPPPNDADGIRDAVARSGAALDAGDTAHAARCFIDYWMGAGSWDRTPEARQGPIAESVKNVRGWATALVGETTPLQAFAEIGVPVLYMTGTKSPASSLGVARVLAKALPRAEVVSFEGLGHMGPLTHPEVVNEAIAGFLDRVMR